VFSPYSVTEIKDACARMHVHPSRDRGQNFLVDERVAEVMIRAAGLSRGDQCLEIGPGLGALTFKLADHGVRLHALEIESKFVMFLREELEKRNQKNVVVVEGDVLQILPSLSSRGETERSRGEVRGTMGFLTEFAPSKIEGFEVTHATIIASLPYSITGDFFSILFDMAFPFTRVVLLLQKEVAMRLVAKPPHMSLLGILAQWHTEVVLVQKVSPSAFWPQPEVESAIVVLDAKKEKAQDGIAAVSFVIAFPLIKRAFKAPRKKIKTTLAHFNLDKVRDLGLLDKRPSELSLDDWVRLGKAINKY